MASSRPDHGPATLAEYVSQYRSERSMTLRELSERTGVSRTSLWRIESGEYVPAVSRCPDSLERIWEVLGGDRNQLLRLSTRCPMCRGLGSMRDR